MREVINIHCGKAGNFIGAQFWETVGSEHALNLLGKPEAGPEVAASQREVLYNETAKGQWNPRTVFIDMDPSSNEAIQSSEIGRLFTPDSFISGKFSSGSNWARAFYGVGTALMDPFMEKIRRIMETCERPQGFQLTHAISGGTGSGLSSKILSEISETYPNCINSSYTLLPWMKEFSANTVPYNSTFAMNHLVENCVLTTFFDNFSLERILFSKSKKLSCTYKDMNSLIALAMSGQTAGMRFPGELNTTLRHIALNLVPFPRLHFFLPSVTPIEIDEKIRMDAEDIIKTMTQPDMMMANANPLHGRYLTATSIFRGPFKTGEVETGLLNLMNKNSSYYVEWISDNFKSCVCPVPPTGYPHSTFFLGNSMAVAEILKALGENITEQFRIKAFIHHFLNEGMDEMEITEAESNLNDLVSEYTPCCHCCCEEEDEQMEQQTKLINSKY